MRHLFALLLALPVTAAQYDLFTTNTSFSTNVFVSAVGATVRIDGGNPVVVSATVASPSNHLNNTVHVFYQFTADGTNWTRTNIANTLVATTFGGTTGATIGSNIAESGWSGVRLAGFQGSTVTNLVISNVSIGTWRSPR